MQATAGWLDERRGKGEWERKRWEGLLEEKGVIIKRARERVGM
jgi:hypothetical protein